MEGLESLRAASLHWELLEDDGILTEVAYDGHNLYVRFAHSGRRFCYEKVPRYHYHNLLTSPRPGRYFNYNIKKNYEAETF